ncbi:unnamed protein product [Nippostrongylus brasiliensis]|uniref:SCP domain-containing protein n=1 Tax=Nippostrongylus brasiliensis TaxID=27835 RepID=A0A0N4Y157_NIPBR|nr:unnamed protein product [Nippostrongylus brasiliensis]
MVFEDLRARLANGKVAKNNGRYLPKAADMRQLTYDCNLETQARNYAVQCTTVGSGMWGTSENFRRVSTSVAANRVQAIDRATKSWWKQVRRVPGIGRRMVTFKSHHQQSTIRFFTLMAWSSVTSIGCGVKQCGSIFNVVCRYSPAYVLLDVENRSKLRFVGWKAMSSVAPFMRKETLAQDVPLGQAAQVELSVRSRINAKAFTANHCFGISVLGFDYRRVIFTISNAVVFYFSSKI